MRSQHHFNIKSIPRQITPFDGRRSACLASVPAHPSPRGTVILTPCAALRDSWRWAGWCGRPSSSWRAAGSLRWRAAPGRGSAGPGRRPPRWGGATGWPCSGGDTSPPFITTHTQGLSRSTPLTDSTPPVHHPSVCVLCFVPFMSCSVVGLYVCVHSGVSLVWWCVCL